MNPLWLLLLIPAALAVFVAILLIRAIRFTPKAQPALLEGEEAVACGLIDGVGGFKEALAALRDLTKKAQADACAL